MSRVIGRTDDGLGESTSRNLAVALTLATAALLISGCSSGGIVNTDDARPTTQTKATTQPPTAPRSNDNLAKAFDFYAQPYGVTGYYFTSPSKRWMCAIVPRERAGCQSATGSRIAITGAPDSVLNAQGEDSAPNAIQVDRTNDAQFVAVDSPGYSLLPGPATILPFDKLLIVAGFRCNVQEASGMSCLSELTGKGFTFSTDGYTMQYTDLPA